MNAKEERTAALSMQRRSQVSATRSADDAAEPNTENPGFPARANEYEPGGGDLSNLRPRNILFACNGKPDKSRAFDVALQYASDRTTTLRCTCIIERLPVAADLIMEGSLRQDQAACARKLSELRLMAAKANIPIDVEAVFGVPHEQIVRQVHAHDIDLLILPVKRLGIVAYLKQWLIAGHAARGSHRLNILAVDEKGAASFTA